MAYFDKSTTRKKISSSRIKSDHLEPSNLLLVSEEVLTTLHTKVVLGMLLCECDRLAKNHVSDNGSEWTSVETGGYDDDVIRLSQCLPPFALTSAAAATTTTANDDNK